MDEFEKIMKPMGRLNEILTEAFKDIKNIKFESKKKLIINLKSGTRYYFYFKDDQWEYDGWEQSMMPCPKGCPCSQDS